MIILPVFSPLWRSGVLVLLVGLLYSPTARPEAAEGVVAHWNFNEGRGNVVRDMSGNGLDGAIHGARHVPHGDGYALEFDGSGSHVNFGKPSALDLGDRFSLELWMKPDPNKESYFIGVIMGKTLRDYALTYNPNTEAAYLFVARRNARGEVEPGRWNHVVGVFDGDEIRIYINGREAWYRRRGDVKPADRATLDVPFLIGASSAEEPNPEAEGQSFKGRIAEAAVYRRVLTPEDIKRRHVEGNLTGEPEVLAAYVPPLKVVAADVQTQLMGELPDGAFLSVALLRDGATVATERIDGIRARTSYPVEFAAAGLSYGTYTVAAAIFDGQTNQALGWTAEVEVEGADYDRFPMPVANGTRLNTLVTELVNTPEIPSAEQAVPYRREKEGWTFVAVDLHMAEGDSVELVCRTPDGREEVWIPARGGETPPVWAGEENRWETMRLQAGGQYALMFQVTGNPRLENLVVREVPEITWMHTGPSTWARDGAERNPEYFAQRSALRAANVIRTDPRRSILPGHRPFIEQWQEAGRHVMVSAMLARPDGRRIVEQVGPDGEREWIDHFFAAEPTPFPSPVEGVLAWLRDYHIEGIWGMGLDELHARFQYAPIWTEAIRQFHEETGAAVGLYTGDVFRSPRPLDQLMRTVVATDGRFYWERYEPTRPTLLTQWRALENIFAFKTAAWIEAFPSEINRNTLLHLGVSSIPGMTLDNWPQADFKVFLDLRMNMIANDEIFEDIGGLSMWNSAALEEETVIWLGKLNRHYWIEGRRDMLSDTPFILTHAQNPGFVDGLQGWTVSAAQEVSVRADESLGFGNLQGLYPYPVTGDEGVVLRRNADRPNAISQTVTDLIPGRLYAVDMVAADFEDMRAEELQRARIEIEGGSELEDLGYAWLRTNRRGVSPNYPERQSVWLTYFRKVFRATGPEAVLTISDWVGEDEPGAAVNQEMMIGYLTVRPFLDTTKFGPRPTPTAEHP